MLKSKGGNGYNVATGKYEDLIAAGVVDPAKVMYRITNAGSVSGEETTSLSPPAMPEHGRHGRHGRDDVIY